jgi:hypothetical protein
LVGEPEGKRHASESREVYRVLLGQLEGKRHALESREVYRVLVGELEERRPLGRPRRRWDHNGS